MFANRTSRWSIGAALVCVVVLAASWFLLISPRRADAADIRGQAATSRGQAAQLQVQIADLKSEFADLPKRESELAAVQRQLPPTAAIPTLVRDLQSITAQAGVSLISIAPGTPAVVSAPTGEASTSVGAGSLIGIPITVTITGEYFEASLFLKNLQTKMARSFLVTGLTLGPASTVVTASVGASPTVTPSAASSSGATPAATPTISPTDAAVPTLDSVSMTVNGSVFVLLDGTVTLDDVAAAAKAAAIGGVGPTVTPVPSSTAVAK